ncbi:MAG TPA: potassium transporter TrkA [Erysipelotrichaceae bacterium]|nr:potassium transporter TrkA [Erysipelotrichaceae bacterium]
MFESKNKKVAIIGCSRLGATIANRLSLLEYPITVLDKEEGSFRKLSDTYSGYTFVADAESVKSLYEARVNEADIVIAVTDNDNVNIMVSEVCSRIFGVEKVLCRIYDSSKEPLCRQYQIHFIDTSKLSAMEFEKALGGFL